MNQEIKNRIVELLESLCYKDEHGQFYAELYANYRDELSDRDISKITESDCPLDTFYELLDEIYFDNDEEDYILDAVMKDSELSELIQDFEADEGDIRDECREMFFVHFPYDHYLSQELLIDILVDAGDCNYDYVCNNFGPHYDCRDNSIPEESGLLWLVRQQGYNKSTLKKFLANPRKENPFLFSVYEELLNCGSCINALTFLVKMPLNEYFKLFDAIHSEKLKNESYYPTQRKGRGYLILSKDTTCGLYDSWNGGGGLLEIELEKDVRLPIRLIDSAKQDGVRGHSIKSIYGVTSALWEDNAVKEIHSMKKSA